MAQQATQQTTINAPPEQCFDVAVDFERYPEWARDVKEAEVVARDDEGRAVEVAFRAAGLGRSARYRLHYDYDAAPGQLSWELVDSDLLRRLDGVYEFHPGADDTTLVTYHLTVDLKVPLPGFVKRRAEKMIMSTALESLREAVERDVTA
jgi:ribosome-associated toxin RatA of RatAB toxin-antitoxin module